MARAWRTYTEEDRESVRIALVLHSGNLSEVARSTGIPYSTVKTWRNKPPPEPEPDEVLSPALIEAASEVLRHDKRGALIEAAWDLAGAAFTQAKAALPRASAQSAAIVAGIAIDKAQLLAGEATSRSEVLGTVVHEPNADAVAAVLNILSEAGIIPPAPADDGMAETLRLLPA